ncbi:MAG: hypothetical protein JW787_06205 [Sedimentisphaerales bacterium]|nr:hypothetical protein [Sedimentisphaerales bacterium]
MSIRVKLIEIIGGLECQSDENSSYLDKETGEVVLVSDQEMRAVEDNDSLEDYPEWELEQIAIARDIINETGRFLELPTKFDINEYEIMERFCLSLEDAEMSDLLYSRIKGSGAFRRFKETIYQNDIEQDWFTYRNEVLKEIAVDWCRENDIEIDESQEL